MRTLLAPFVLCLAPVIACAQSEVVQPAKAEKATEIRTLALKPGSSLKVKNINGAVRLEAWDREEVEFRGEFKPSSRDEHVKVVIDRTGSGLEIRGEVPKGTGSTRGPECRMDLKVPRRVLATISTVNGSISLKGTLGESTLESVNGSVSATTHGEGLHAKTVNGGIQVESIQGEVHLKTVNGGIVAKDLDTQGKAFEASTVNGGVHLQAAGLKGRLEATTLNGGLSLKAKGAEQVEVGKRRMTALFPGGTQTLTISTVNGGITVD